MLNGSSGCLLPQQVALGVRTPLRFQVCPELAVGDRTGPHLLLGGPSGSFDAPGRNGLLSSGHLLTPTVRADALNPHQRTLFPARCGRPIEKSGSIWKAIRRRSAALCKRPLRRRRRAMIPALHLPMAPTEALPVDAIPTGDDWQYEPKWDGFRCLIIRDGQSVELQSKAGKSLSRYFPEAVAAATALPATRFVLDERRSELGITAFIAPRSGKSSQIDDTHRSDHADIKHRIVERKYQLSSPDDRR
jgi:hypothetical protein